MTRWFTSDEHYGHANVISLCARPFRDVEHMTEELIARHNARVMPTDEVWHLGDFCWKERLVAPVLGRLNGRHYLVVGNHDTCHPMHRKHEKAQRRYLDAGFLKVLPWSFLELGGTRVLLHHMPYTSDGRHDEKYAEWRPKYEGLPLLHGHVHQSWKTQRHMVNVGVDVWDYAPVSQEEIEAALAEMPR